MQRLEVSGPTHANEEYIYPEP